MGTGLEKKTNSREEKTEEWKGGVEKRMGGRKQEGGVTRTSKQQRESQDG